jgi:hypothetical protein
VPEALLIDNNWHNYASGSYFACSWHICRPQARPQSIHILRPDRRELDAIAADQLCPEWTDRLLFHNCTAASADTGSLRSVGWVRRKRYTDLPVIFMRRPCKPESLIRAARERTRGDSKSLLYIGFQIRTEQFSPCTSGTCPHVVSHETSVLTTSDRHAVQKVFLGRRRPPERSNTSQKLLKKGFGSVLPVALEACFLQRYPRVLL